MSEVHVPDVPPPSYPLCWAHNPLMVRCDRKAGHTGPHSWEWAAAVEAAFREGLDTDRDYYCRDGSEPSGEDAAWLASDAKARLT